MSKCAGTCDNSKRAVCRRCEGERRRDGMERALVVVLFVGRTVGESDGDSVVAAVADA